MMPILKDFLKFAKRKLGGDVPIAETDIDADTLQALSDAMGLLNKAHEKLEEVKRPDVVYDELLEFKKERGVSFSKDNLRGPEYSSDEGERVGKKTKLSSRTDDSDGEDSDEGEPVKKKTKVSGRSTKDTTKRPSKQRGKKKDSDDSEPVRKKSKLSSESTKDTTKKGFKKKSKSPKGIEMDGCSELLPKRRAPSQKYSVIYNSTRSQ
jgi:hypothetical protein